VIVVALDIAKAFDKVNRNILIQKLKWYGISSEIIDSFLSNRSQFVSLVQNDKTLSSSMKATLLGVPQGSSLSNLLFAVYMNDFPHVIVHSVPILFADDDYLMISGDLKNINEVIAKLEIDLKSANHWMEANHAKINTDKIKFLVFSKKNAARHLININIKINGEPISRVNSL